ncbi:MAG: glycosyltransferase family 2 protein [Chitinophagaceae bacterium]
MSYPLVTIGIPTFNQEKYISEAIESALEQDYPNLEIAVADDCSTDDTADIAGKYLRDPRFKYFRNSCNVGRVGNYKKLLYVYARGEWYLNLDGDDFLVDTNFISTAIECISQNKQLVLFQSTHFREDNLGSRTLKTFPQTQPLTIVDGKDFLINYPEKMGVQHLAAVYNRKKAMEIDFYRSDTLRSDSESILRLALKGQVAFYNKPVGVWRDHGNNETWLLNEQTLSKEKGVFDDIAKEASGIIEHRKLSKWLKKVKENIDLYYMDSCMAQKPLFPNCKFFIEHFRPRLSYLRLFLKHLLHSFRFSK